MRKFLVLIMTSLLLFGCNNNDISKIEGEDLGFSVKIYSKGKSSSAIEDEAKIESVVRQCLKNTTERMRLLYFAEELEADLKKEQAIEVSYKDKILVDSDYMGELGVDRVIIFQSGRLKADNDSEYIPVITVNDSEISVWTCKWKGIG